MLSISLGRVVGFTRKNPKRKNVCLAALYFTFLFVLVGFVSILFRKDVAFGFVAKGNNNDYIYYNGFIEREEYYTLAHNEDAVGLGLFFVIVLSIVTLLSLCRKCCQKKKPEETGRRNYNYRGKIEVQDLY